MVVEVQVDRPSNKSKWLSWRLSPLVQKITMILLMLLILLGTGVGLWRFWPVPPVAPIDPYLALRSTLTETGVNASQRFDGLYNELTRLQSLQGWQVTTIKLVDNNTIVSVARVSGSIEQLKQWAAENGFIHRVDQASVVLFSQTPNIPVLTEAVLMDVSDVTGYLADAIYKLLPDIDLRVSEDIEQDSYRQRHIVIALTAHWRHDLVDLGTIIDGLPVSFVDGELTVDNGLLKGELNFVILGE